MSTLSESLGKLGSMVVDFTELEVITLTGTLSQNFSALPAPAAAPAAGAAAAPVGTSPTALKWADLVSSAVTNPAGEVVLAASTLIKFDGDSYKFISIDPRVTPAHLAAHDAAVKAGMDTRVALLGFFRDTLAKVTSAR